MDLGEVIGCADGWMASAPPSSCPWCARPPPRTIEHVAEQQEHEKQALEICAEAIEQHGLPMKLIDADLSFDNTRLVFFFSADGRVDSRELVRDLARSSACASKLRQIGVRDEAKLLGGWGHAGGDCAARLSCATSNRWASAWPRPGAGAQPGEDQGLCDRLMCACSSSTIPTARCATISPSAASG